MSEEVEMTPIAPEEGGMEPPKAASADASGNATAATVKMKPVIRKPMIRKPVIGGAKPVTLKPATGTPPPPAAVPEAAAAPAVAPTATPTAAPAAAPAAGPQLKSITSPIAAQAILHKTGIIAEGILTPAQAQAAKTTSRISLESAIGVAPTIKSAAPMKTIKLRRPTDIPPAPGAVKIEPAAATPSAPKLEPAAPAAATEPSVSPTPAPAVSTDATTVAAPPPADSTASTITQKKTLKIQRPGFKRPTVSGLRRPGDPAPAPAAPAVGGTGDVADLSTVADIPDIKPLPAGMDAVEDDSNTVAGVPAWLNTMTLVAGIAALVVIGFCTWTLFREAVGPAAGPNDLASFHSDTDYRR